MSTGGGEHRWEVSTDGGGAAGGEVRGSRVCPLRNTTRRQRLWLALCRWWLSQGVWLGQQLVRGTQGCQALVPGWPAKASPPGLGSGKRWVRIPGVLWARVADLPIVLGWRRTPRKFPRGSDKDGNQGWGLSGGARSPDVLPEPMQAETCERPPLERAVFRWLMSLGSAVTTALAAAAGAGRAPDAWTQASRGLSGCSVTLQRRAGVPRTET